MKTQIIFVKMTQLTQTLHPSRGDECDKAPRETKRQQSKQPKDTDKEDMG
jgi:hypothetical protein